ncbi:cell division protein FtsX [Sedimentitalea todarodis]|uniref:Cell division protein FtsX n=1 Tax=Sedimentitalea todarodis TaxID=1631240 RepID=A0ABU3VI13_9RHOB|nr:FtsX-like permease family protein [Sedimentitalea todarodis]MDU9005828.1 cell division protein FtsX [Sedimentitalea todarodis]
MSIRTIRRLLAGDAQSDRIVPPSGITAHLILFAAAAMAFLAVFALALALAAGRVADRWSDDLSQSATLRISGPAEQRDAQTEAALTILQETPGIASSRPLSVQEQAMLLAPWLGTDLPLQDLPLPQLIEVIADQTGYDTDALQQRLTDEVPGAVLDDHSRWSAPVVDAVQGLRRLGLISLLLIAGTLAATVTLAARAVLAANAQVIEVLRLVGAQDRFVTRAFVRRLTLRALVGASSGMVLGLLAVLLLPSGGEADGFLTDIGFHGIGWLVPLLVPAMTAAIAFVATWLAARQKLTEFS